MTTFDDRKKAFESKFAHDAETMFKAAARRNRLLGHWLAEKLKIADAEAYAKSVVVTDLQEAGDDDVVRKVMADVKEAGAAISEAEIRDKMKAFAVQAMEQIMSETRD
ncbi:MAG: DUF1476 domain-containing protein [Pikeienuella sp.]